MASREKLMHGEPVDTSFGAVIDSNRPTRSADDGIWPTPGHGHRLDMTEGSDLADAWILAVADAGTWPTPILRINTIPFCFFGGLNV